MVTAIDLGSFELGVATAPVAIEALARHPGDWTPHRAAASWRAHAEGGSYTLVLAAAGRDDAKAVDAAVPAVTSPATTTPAATGTSSVGPPGTWTRYATSYESGTEAEYQSWYNLTYDPKRDVFYGVSWGGVIAAFSPTAGRWTSLSPKIGGGVHNRTTTYDPINDRVWLGRGTGSQLVGMNYFDPNTRRWINHPMTGKLPGSESAMIFDAAGKQFVIFGGWGKFGVHTFTLDPPASEMISAGITGGPAFSRDAQKMTAWRSALDTKRNRIIYVDTDGSLWTLPLPLRGWQRVMPTGTPPPILTQYVYDAANDALVGWSSSPRIAGGDPATGTTRETWLLPLSTLAWTKAASFAGGQTVPIDASYTGYAMAYDPIRRQTILHTLTRSSNYSPTTWAYRYPAGGPATPTPAPAQSPAPLPVPPPKSSLDDGTTTVARSSAPASRR